MSVVKYAAAFLALFASAAQAAPGNYVVQCTAQCTAPDGTTQAAGTNLNRIVADPNSFNPGANLALVPDTGQALYVPPAPTPTQIPALDFIRRFTTAEQTALMSANPTWGVEIAAAGTINVTDPTLLAQVQAAVTAGALTQARATQVLNLSVPSP